MTVQHLHHRQWDAGNDASGNVAEEGNFARPLRHNGGLCGGRQLCRGGQLHGGRQRRQRWVTLPGQVGRLSRGQCLH